MTFRNKNALVLSLLVVLLSATNLAASATITASQTRIVLEPGELGTTTIGWSTSGLSTARVLVSVEGGVEKTFAGGPSGSKTAPWIGPGKSYEFRLYAGVHQAQLLASVTVVGVENFGGTLWAAPYEVTVPRGSASSTEISWTSDLQRAQVWVSKNSGLEILMTDGASGSVEVPWINGHFYFDFTLYAGTDHSEVLDTLRVYPDPAYAVGVNYHATSGDFHADAFLNQYHEPGIRDEVRMQLQSMADRGANVISTAVWFTQRRDPEPDTTPPPPSTQKWRTHFPPTLQEMLNLQTYASDVATVQAADGHRLRLDLTLSWLGTADFTCGCVEGIDVGLGFLEDIDPLQFTAWIEETVDLVLDAVGQIYRPDGRKVVDTLYFQNEVLMGPEPDNQGTRRRCYDGVLVNECLATEAPLIGKRNQRWMLRTHYPRFVAVVRAAGLNPSLDFIAAAGDEQILDDYQDATFPELDDHLSMFWIYRSLQVMRDEGLILPRRIDASTYLDPDDPTAPGIYAALAERVYADANATLPLLGVPAEFGVVESSYLLDNEQRERLGEAFAAQRPAGLRRVLFWTTPNGGGPGTDVGFPFEFEDFIGDPLLYGDKIGVYRPDAPLILLDADGSLDWTPAFDLVVSSFSQPTDVRVVGDWNGDGDDDLGVYRPSTNTFILDIDESLDWTPGVDITAQFGQSGDLPLIGDWNGDGDDDLGIYRPSAMRFILDLDESLDWTPGIDIEANFGQAGDLPVIGDWNGDGDDDLGLYRPDAANFILDLDESLGWTPGIDIETGFGLVGDLPITGDWNNNGNDDIGVYRPATSNFILDLDGSLDYTPGVDLIGGFGQPGDLPVIGRW